MIETASRSLWGRPIVIGGGIAGAVAALTLAPRPVLLLDPAPPGRSAATRWAQGGLAAAVGVEDSPLRHAEDTVAAGAGLADAHIAETITAAGPETVAALEAFGVRFDRDASGAFALGLEAAHSHRRILHVQDATGAAIIEALNARIAQTPSVERLSGTALRIVTDERGVSGLIVRHDGKAILFPTRAIVLATGGVGGLWRSTTNPAAAQGIGLVLAARAGAVLMDIEFVQFHPTALAVGADPMPLVSEAVRGEGATLINAEGARFMTDAPGGDLAPRDILARAVFRQKIAGGGAALDVRHWPTGKFAARFPNINRVLARYGLDPARDPIPVRPAAHYHMGGVKAAPNGRTEIAGLWACGEVACTGFQGANRLASNSLLEGAVCGRWAAEDIAGMDVPTPPETALPDFMPPAPSSADIVTAMRDTMDSEVGVVRDAAGLARAIEKLTQLRRAAKDTDVEDALSAALLIARAAERRRESRGAHWRSDAVASAETPTHSFMRWSDLDG